MPRQAVDDGDRRPLPLIHKHLGTHLAAAQTKSIAASFGLPGLAYALGTDIIRGIDAFLFIRWVVTKIE